MNVWLDDIRDPAMYGRTGWTWAKTAAEAIDLLKTGAVEAISLDHDLCIESTIGMAATAPTGLDVALWMEENGMRPTVTVHTMNDYGRSCIAGELRRSWKPGTWAIIPAAR